MAIEAFNEEVEAMCKEVYERHKSELELRMGIAPAGLERLDESDPTKPFADLGVFRKAQRDCCFSLYLHWGDVESGDDQHEIAVRIWLNVYRKNLRDEIWESFRRKNPLCRVKKVDTYSLTLEAPLKSNNLSSADDVLDKLVLEWLEYCRSVGGLNLKKQGPS